MAVCMKNFFKGLLLLCLISLTIAGCKVDPPIYPAGTLQSGTITYSTDGTAPITIKDNVLFEAILPGGEAPQGNLYIYGSGANNVNFTLMSTVAAEGDHPLATLSIGNLILVEGTGTVKITKYTTTDGKTGTVAGTFTADMTDPDSGDIYEDVTGTFEITQ